MRSNAQTWRFALLCSYFFFLRRSFNRSRGRLCAGLLVLVLELVPGVVRGLPLKRSPRPFRILPVLSAPRFEIPPADLRSNPARATLSISVLGSPNVPSILTKLGNLTKAVFVGASEGTRFTL